eukprot:SAG31_NODE_1828_length_7159_cov_58.418980_4_plen_77_part_00
MMASQTTEILEWLSHSLAMIYLIVWVKAADVDFVDLRWRRTHVDQVRGVGVVGGELAKHPPLDMTFLGCVLLKARL